MSRRSTAPRSRGLSTITAAIVIVVLLVLVGLGTFALEGGFSSGTPLTCQPITAPACAAFENLHDVTLLLPFKSVQEGSEVPVTASLPSGESATGYTFNFGDGTGAIPSKSATLEHAFPTVGTYLVSVSAMVNGVDHDNLHALTQVVVTASYSASTAGNVPQIAGLIVSNSTAPAGTPQVTAAIVPGQTVSFSASYTTSPTNPAFSVIPPTIAVSTGGTLSKAVSGATSASATASFNDPGVYEVSYVGGATASSGAVPIDYNWTVYVGPSGSHPGVAGLAQAKDPHPGTVISYELAPGGAFSEDPAIDYETVGAEPIFNVYQTLLAYNGTQNGPTPQSFVPELAACVPGSAECQQLFGQTLVNGWNYTFVIEPNATFYDPSTHVSWPVYPSDVLFSMIRTLGFADLPAPTVNPGWIQAQALLSPGNETWDTLHGAYNNTPANVSAAMTVNETAGGVCPAAAMSAPYRGCITFHAHGHNEAWPYFLELVADPLGGAIVPCGWFSAAAQQAGIPYWTKGNVSGAGDAPCAMPGDGMGVNFSAMPSEGWDQWEQLGSGAFGGQYLGHVQWSMVGSGPYALSAYQIAVGYTLKANPAYTQNPDCTWAGCQPKPNDYAGVVEVQWETSAEPGEQAYISGTADLASIPSTDFSLFIQLLSLGKIQAISAPTISIAFYPFDLDFSVGGAQKYTTSTINVQGNWFSYLGMREFFARAYPYQTIESTINTKDGVQLAFNSGGAIPQFMANYYPTNIAWPSTDPCTSATNSTCPTYWWDQMRDTSSPYYDQEAAACTSANPCSFPMFGETGSPANDQVMALWTSELTSLSGGALKVTPVDIDFVALVTNGEDNPPGQDPQPIYTLGWAPDYPDPTDYVTPLYSANATYTHGDAVEQSLVVPQFTSGCQPYTDVNYYVNLTAPSQACQGTAYRAMLLLLQKAAVAPVGPGRVLLYDQAEVIASDLVLYTYTGQSNAVGSVASWLTPSSIDTNVCLGGDALFYDLQGNGVA